MCKIQICVIIGVFIGAIPSLRAQSITPGTNGVVYVKETPSGDKSGKNWDNTCSLSDALQSAKSNATINQIWVAAGTYKPLYAPDGSTTNQRDRAFVLVDSVKMYGGFVGTETDIDQRPFGQMGQTLVETGSSIQTPSILSGNLDNGGTAYHVLVGAGLTKETLLDGFIVTGGNANGTDSIRIGVSETDTLIVHRYNGGGIYLTHSSPTLTNLLINGNTATKNGGAIYSLNSGPKVINSFITDNTAEKGSALYSQPITITVSPPNLLLFTSEKSDTLKATILPADVITVVVWSSADTNIVKVNEVTGEVTAKRGGTVKIYATAMGVTDSCTVTVLLPSITISPNPLTLCVDSTYTLTATVLPAGAPVSWGSTNTAIATVDATGKATGIAGGTVKIYATAMGVTDSCTVTVLPIIIVSFNIGSGWYNTTNNKITWAAYGAGGQKIIKIRGSIPAGENLPEGFDNLQWSFSPSAAQKEGARLKFGDEWGSGIPVPVSTEMSVIYDNTGTTSTHIYVWYCNNDGSIRGAYYDFIVEMTPKT